ncbi:11588_t:CDS:2 [Funneliformis geosporum]|nr:11588_t:CDS:2 [Funneliformis geosporum]
MATENNKEPTNSKQQIQQLKTELNSLKSKLNNLSDTTQKTQLENKLSNLENQINNLSQPNTTLKKLEQDIKQIQQELGKKPDKPNPPTDPNQLQFTVYYFVSLGQNHIELTKKGSCYTITFSSQDAEKYHNQDHVFYFSKNNHKFSLVPVSTSPPNNPNNKKENHSQIKELVSQGKLEKNKLFTIRYEKEDEKSRGGLVITFNESNQELEITEA